MTSYLLIALIIALYSFQTLFCRLYNNHFPGRKDSGPVVFSVLYGVLVTVITLAISGFHYAPSRTTLLLGLGNALVLLGYNISLINATGCGSYAVANFCQLSGGILVPLIQSVLFYGHSFTLRQYGGILVMLMAFLALNIEGMRGKTGRGEKREGRFALFCALLFLFNGLYGALIVAQQTALDGAERTEMIVTTFMGTAILALIVLMRLRGRQTAREFRQNGKSTLFLGLCCLSAASALNLLMYIMKFVNAAILYTLENGGVLLLSTLYAVTLFKEKFSPVKAVGVGLAVVSLIMLS